MHFKKIALASAVASILAGCGADDQPYKHVEKPETLQLKDVVKTDQVYLYMPSLSHAPRYAGSMHPFVQGQEKLVRLSFEAEGNYASSGRLVARQISDQFTSQAELDALEPARWVDHSSDNRPVLEIPVSFVDYQCRENDYNECTNKEEKVDTNEVPWAELKYFDPSFAKTTITEYTWDTLLNYHGDCNTPIGSPRLRTDGDWKGYEVTEDGVINFEIERTYQLSGSPRCIINGLNATDWDVSKQSFTVSHFYSLVPLDLVRSPSAGQTAANDKPTYDPVIYKAGDEDTYGIFDAKVRPVADPSYVGGDFDQSFMYMQRWNPKLEYVDYHLSDSFLANEDTLFFKRITEEVFDRINPQLKMAGVPQIKLHEPSGKNSGDLRYNVVNLIDEPLSNSLLGYAPSASNPLTGELVHGHINQYSGVIRSLSRFFWDRIATDYNNGRVEQVKNPSAVVSDSTEASTTDEGSATVVATSTVSVKSISESGIDLEAAASIIPAMAKETQQDILKQIFEINSSPDFESNDGELSLEAMDMLEDAERRLWAEHNMYHADAMRNGATFKSLPTEIAGMSVDYQDPKYWNGEVGVPGNLKTWDEMTTPDQTELGLFIAGVYYAKTLVHELGHNLGLRHNFKGSTDSKNRFTQAEAESHGLRAVPGYTSIMDYNPSLLNALPVFGTYDLAALRFSYKRQVEQVLTEEQLKENPDSKYLSIAKYDPIMLEEALNRNAVPNDLVYDGAISALKKENADVTLRTFHFCTDGNASLNEDCNRWDEGRNRAEISEYYLERYRDTYYDRTTRGMSDDFHEGTVSLYPRQRLAQFNHWRNSLHDFEFYYGFVKDGYYGENMPTWFGMTEFTPQLMLGLPKVISVSCDQDEDFKTSTAYDIYCGSSKAVSGYTEQLNAILMQPDHTCHVADKDDLTSFVKLRDVISEWDHKSFFPINHVPTTCFDDGVKQALAEDGLTVKGEVGKILNGGKAPRPYHTNTFSNSFDYVGHWGDKVAAAAVLVDRLGRRNSTNRSTLALKDLPTFEVSDGNIRSYNWFRAYLEAMLLGTQIREHESLQFRDDKGNAYSLPGDHLTYSWDAKIEKIPYSGSYAVRNAFGLPRFEETPLNKAILNSMMKFSAGHMVNQEDEEFAREISIRSEYPHGIQPRSYTRTNGTKYYATPQNDYAWVMIGMLVDYNNLQAAEAAGTDLTTVNLLELSLDQFQDADKKVELAKQMKHISQSLEYMPVYNSKATLDDDLLNH